jgi:hypothetical protein
LNHVRILVSGGEGGITGREISGLRFKGCRFEKSLNRAFQVNSPCSGIIDSCSIHENTFPIWTAPYYHVLAADTNQITLNCVPQASGYITKSSWSITNNLIRNRHPDGNASAIYVGTGGYGHTVMGNVFEYPAGYPYFFETQGRMTTHIVKGNTMTGNVQCIQENTPSTQCNEEANSVAVGAAATTLNVTLTKDMIQPNYDVYVDFGWGLLAAGEWWITNKKSKSFTINWTNAPGGGGSTLNWRATQ